MKINKKKIWDNIEPLVFGIAIAMLIKTLFIQAYFIPSGSMMNTLLIGDCLLANKVAYSLKLPFSDKELINIGKPNRHDIVIFKYPNNPKINYIKRVIGLPGETLEIINNKTYINGNSLEDGYVILNKTPFSSVPENFGPIKVPVNSIFVMGDNRNNSCDSRDWGFVSIEKIIGKATIIYWSWDRTKKIPRFSRICKLLSKNTSQTNNPKNLEIKSI